MADIEKPKIKRSASWKRTWLYIRSGNWWESRSL